MARIRSVHPGLFTDEVFVSLSMPARVLLIGIWTECDDHGAFEWKPVSLKMRLMPVDNVDIPALLSELERANAIRKYQHVGREYGLVRNFAKYQRPKSPKYVHHIPHDLRNYIGSSHRGGEIHEDERGPFPQNGEIPPQMEEGGGIQEPSQGRGRRTQNKIGALGGPPIPNGRAAR